MRQLNSRFISILALVVSIIVGGIILINYLLNLSSNKSTSDKVTINKPVSNKQEIKKPTYYKEYYKEFINLNNKVYRRKITFNLNNHNTLRNFQIAITLDTNSLISENKLSFIPNYVMQGSKNKCRRC